MLLVFKHGGAGKRAVALRGHAFLISAGLLWLYQDNITRVTEPPADALPVLRLPLFLNMLKPRPRTPQQRRHIGPLPPRGSPPSCSRVTGGDPNVPLSPHLPASPRRQHRAA